MSNSSSNSPASSSTLPPLLSPQPSPPAISNAEPSNPPSPPPKLAFDEPSDYLYEDDLGSHVLKPETPLFYSQHHRTDSQSKNPKQGWQGQEQGWGSSSERVREKRASNLRSEYPPESDAGDEDTRRIEQNLRTWSAVERHRRASVRRSTTQSRTLPPNPISHLASAVGSVSRRGSLLFRGGGSVNTPLVSKDDGEDAAPMSEMRVLEEGRADNVVGGQGAVNHKRQATLERLEEEAADDTLQPLPSTSTSTQPPASLAPTMTNSGSSSPSPEERTARAQKTGSKFAEHLASQVLPDSGMAYVPGQQYDAPSAQERKGGKKGKGRAYNSEDTLISMPYSRYEGDKMFSMERSGTRESVTSFDSTLDGRSVLSHTGTVSEPLVIPGGPRSDQYDGAYRKTSPDPNVGGGRRRKRQGTEEGRRWNEDEGEGDGREREERGFMEWLMCGCFGSEDEGDEQAGRTNPMG